MDREAAARDLHSAALVVDSHNDSIVVHLRRRGLSIAGSGAPRRDEPRSAVAALRDPLDDDAGVQLNLPNLRAGSIDVAYFSVDVTRLWGNHLLYAVDALGWFEAEVRAHSDAIAIAASADEIEAARRGGKVAAVLAVENSEVLQRSLYVLPQLHRLGVRSITLTWSYRTEAADGVYEAGTGGGLTSFGRGLVVAMNELGMLVDISHLSEAGFWDVIDLSAAPILASHNCCRALCGHDRNLTDEQIKAIADRGGVVGITFVPDFVDADAPTIDRLLDHIDHAAAVGGVDAVGLGSDFDGGGDVLASAAEYPRITEGLLARGWDEDDVRKVLGLNHLRLFRQVCG